MGYTEIPDAAAVRWLPDSRCDFRAARWISLPQGSPPSTYMLARRAFDLEAAPASAVVHISADLFYRLTINGCFVDTGPVRNTGNVMSYRSFEVSGLLTRGRNAIAVEVYQGREQVLLHRGSSSTRRAASPCRERMALIVQLECEAAAGPVIATGADWKVEPGAAWDAAAALSSAYSQAEVYDARIEPVGWREAGYDDAGWRAPDLDVAERLSADVPPAYRPRGRLEATDVPPLRRSLAACRSIHAVGEVTEIDATVRHDIGLEMSVETLGELATCRVDGAQNLTSLSGMPVTVMNAFAHGDKGSFYSYWDRHPGFPSVKNASLVLDFGELINGHFLLDVEGSDGILDIGWAQALVDGRVLPKLYLTEREGEATGFNLSHACRYRLAAGRRRWESFHYQQFRYVQITFRGMNSPIRLFGFAAVRTEADYGDRGAFACSNETLTWLWNASRRTLQLCTHDLLMDNVVRERGIYSGDVAGALASSAPYCFGDTPVLRHMIRMFTRDRELRRYLLSVLDAPLTSEVEPGDLYFCHPLYFAIALAQNRHSFDDASLVREEITPTLRAYAGYLETLLNEDGVAENLDGKQWVDWAEVDNESGVGAPQNILIALFLGHLAAMCGEQGDPRAADEYRRRSASILRYVWDRFWNETEGLYVDSVVDGRQRTRVFSEHTNYLALLAGLGQGGREELVIRNLGDDKANRVRADVCFFMMYVTQTLFRLGRDSEAMELLSRRYERIRRTGSGTLWEEWSHLMSVRTGTWFARYRSVAQSGAAGQAGVLSSEVLGVRPVKPRFSEFVVRPNTGSLDWARGVVPSPRGDIAVRWERRADAFSLDLEVPPGSVALVHLPAAPRYEMNGELLAHPQDDKGLVVRVPEGSYRFAAIRNRAGK